MKRTHSAARSIINAGTWIVASPFVALGIVIGFLASALFYGVGLPERLGEWIETRGDRP